MANWFQEPYNFKIKTSLMPLVNRKMSETIEEAFSLGITTDQLYSAPTGETFGISKKHIWPVYEPRWTGNEEAFCAEKKRYERDIKIMQLLFDDGNSHVEYLAGHRMYKSKPEVLVAWMGYTGLTWELWENVKDTDMAKNYALINHITFNQDHFIVKHDDEVSEEIW